MAKPALRSLAPVLFGLCAAWPALGQERAALVIGNGAYPGEAAIPDAAARAGAVAGLLRDNGNDGTLR